MLQTFQKTTVSSLCVLSEIFVMTHYIMCEREAAHDLTRDKCSTGTPESSVTNTRLFTILCVMMMIFFEPCVIIAQQQKK